MEQREMKQKRELNCSPPSKPKPAGYFWVFAALALGPIALLIALCLDIVYPGAGRTMKVLQGYLFAFVFAVIIVVVGHFIAF